MNLKGTVNPLVIYGGSIPELRAIKWQNNSKSHSNKESPLHMVI